MTAKKDKKQTSPALTTQRAARLCQLLQILGKGPQTREMLMRRLRADVRKFYRDLEFLRELGIAITSEEGRYHLKEKVGTILGRLPFPDPGLTLGEALQLAKGRTQAHRKLRKQVTAILPEKYWPRR